MHQAVADNNDIFGQTTVISRTICRCIKFLRVTKLRCWKLKLIKKILSTEGHATHIKTNVTWYNSPKCCFIPFIGWKFDASMHTSVRCIGEINRWIKQRSLTKNNCSSTEEYKKRSTNCVSVRCSLCWHMTKCEVRVVVRLWTFSTLLTVIDCHCQC